MKRGYLTFSCFTYKFSPHATPAQMLAAMVHRFRQQAATLGLPADPTRIVTMASLVEKEVHIDAERPLVAGVFTNRLALQMPLATDPAVIYAARRAARPGLQMGPGGRPAWRYVL